MTKRRKRFTFDEDVNEDDMYEMGVFLDNGKVMETIDVLNCLNNLHEENEQLKQQLSEQGTQIDFLKDENTHMRNVLSENKQLKEKIKDLENENEQLKHRCELKDKVIEDCDKLFNKYGVDTFNLQVVEELFKCGDFFYDEYKKLQDENYGLKQTVAQLIKEAKETSQKKEKYNIQPYAIMKRNGDVE